MAKHNSVTLGFDDSAQKTIPVVDPVRSGVKTKLMRIIAMLSRCVRRQPRHQTEETYTLRKTREEESRLEFQRFLYW